MTVSYILWRIKTLVLAHLGLIACRVFGRPLHEAHCPVCERSVRKWMPFHRNVGGGRLQVVPEINLCPFCSSFERTRRIRIWLEQHSIPQTATASLHFAPERHLSKWFRRHATGQYITTDLTAFYVDQKEDITKMSFENDSFDFIYCSHVLEHVPDDRKAMEELFRVLKTGGIVVVEVPIRGDTTYEDDSITSPTERAKHFGQNDHVRHYGRDITERLREVGFQVEDANIRELLNLSDEDLQRMDIALPGLVFFCTKRGGVPCFPGAFPGEKSKVGT